MTTKRLLRQALGLMFVLSLLVACGGEPSGTVTGTATYTDLRGDDGTEPMPGVMIALCRVPEEGLPQGPAVSQANSDELEQICTLQGSPTTLTDADGVFTLDGVPSATYLVMFHPFPDAVEGIEWDGVVVTEAPHNDVLAMGGNKKVIPASGERFFGELVPMVGFWEKGGVAFARTSGWSAAEGMTLSTGSFGSEKFGFWFSIRDERLSPVVEVETDRTAEIEITSYVEFGE